MVLRRPSARSREGLNDGHRRTSAGEQSRTPGPRHGIGSIRSRSPCCRGAALALRRRADRQSDSIDPKRARCRAEIDGTGCFIRTGEAVLAGRLSSVLERSRRGL